MALPPNIGHTRRDADGVALATRTRTAVAQAYDSWPLRFKILVPFAVLSLLYTGLGTFVVARSAASESRAATTGRLRDIADATSDRLLTEQREVATVARTVAATEGIDVAVGTGDEDFLRRLVVPQAANHLGHRITVLTPEGQTLFDIEVTVDGLVDLDPVPWTEQPLVKSALADPGGTATRTGLSSLGDKAAVAAVRRNGFDDRPAGYVVASRTVGPILEELADQFGATISLHAPFVQVGAEFDFPDTGPTDRVQVRSAHGSETREVLVQPVSFGPDTTARLAVGLAAPSGFALLGGSAPALLVLALLTVGAVAVVGLAVAQRITRPLEGLADTAAELRAGNLSHRSTLTSADELGELAGSMNAMAAALEASTTGLERTVAERTAQLEQANERIRAAAERKSDFVSGLSHDLRAPLASAMMAAELLERAELPPDQVRNTARMLRSNANYLLTLLDELLDMAKLEAGRMTVSPEVIELDQLVSEVGADIAPLAQDKGLSFDTDEVPSVRVLADPVRSRRLLTNLLTNAVKFTDAGGITITTLVSDTDVTVSVHDTGRGIAEADIERLFQPYEQVAETASMGTGLGLHISRQIAELQGGSLSVSSIEGEGATFTFSIPLAPPEPDRPRPPRHRARTAAARRRHDG